MTEIDSRTASTKESPISKKSESCIDYIAVRRKDSQQSTKYKKCTKIKSTLPGYLNNFAMEGRAIELRAFYDAPSGEISFKYIVEWEDDVNSAEKYRLKSLNELLSIKDDEPKNAIKQKTMERCRDTAVFIPPVMARCDGPCRKGVPSNKLHTMGRCGHYLCEACFGITLNSDGTIGCSSFDCNYCGNNKKEAIQAYEEEVCHKQRARAHEMRGRGVDVKPASLLSSKSRKSIKTSSSSNCFSFPKKTEYENMSDTLYESPLPKTPSTVTLIEEGSVRPAKTDVNVYPGKAEMLIVKVVLIEKNKFNATLRIFNQMETATSLRVSKALALMLQDKEHTPKEYLNSATVYCILRGKDNKKKFQKVNKEDLATARLYDFPLIGDYVLFVVDTVNYVKNGSNHLPLHYDD